MHNFDDAMILQATDDGNLRGRTTEPYANMVGPFGGVTAAALLQAILRQENLLGEPATFTSNFVTAVAPGEFDIVTRCVRTNRSTQHWYVEMVQDGGVVANATAVTGVHRETWADTEVTPPVAPKPAELPEAQKPPLAWPQQYEMRFAEGELKLDGETSERSTSTLWTRDKPARPLDFPSLTAMCDVFFPRVYVRLGRQIPIGTVSMTIFFHAGSDELARHGDDYVLATATGSRFDRGFFDQSARLWGSGDTLLASSHQIVYFKG